MNSLPQFFGHCMKDINDHARNWMVIHNAKSTHDQIFNNCGIFCSLELDKSKHVYYNSDVLNETPNKELK